MNNWQPIETAPKDGLPVDLWHNGRWFDCRWDAENGAWYQEQFNGFKSYLYFNPTHWMRVEKP